MGSAGVLFDVDGTLVDTSYLHTVAWSRAFADHGVWAPMNAIHRLVGQGGDQLMFSLLGRTDPHIAQARALHYQELQGDTRVFPGAAALLKAVHGMGLAVVLATSSPSDELGRALKLIDCESSVDAVTTADDVSASKPDPEIFLQAMQVGGIDAGRALAVGDSVWDVEAAARAGIGCLAVESGGFSHHELSEAGALHVYRDVEQLHQWLQTSAVARLQ
jgi:HAD superfamily hydrolase (TIGR01509 family)